MNETQYLISERIFDAPREAVWRAWTDPEWLMRWWGPEHFTSPAARMDVQPGGRYLWGMRDPGGHDYWSTGVFQEVVPLERLVYTDSFSDEHGNVISPAAYGMGEDFPAESTITVLLEDLGGRTRMRVYTDQKPDGEMGDMAVLGWNQSFDKLAASLRS